MPNVFRHSLMPGRLNFPLRGGIHFLTPHKKEASKANAAGITAQAKVFAMEEESPSVILLKISGGMSALVSGDSRECGSLKSIAPTAPTAPAEAAPPPFAVSNLVRLPEK